MLYCLILLLCLSSTYLSLSLNQDATILRQAKLGFSDPAQSLSSWSDNDDITPCKWIGVSCDDTSTVVSVDLSSFMLVGPFPSILCNLPSLHFLSLYNNSINGSLSGDDFNTCRNLISLDLSENLLVGSIPKSLPFNLPNLKFLNISGNNLSDTIPASFGEFQKLESLNLAGNFLSGTIPASLGNVTTLKELKLAYNLFSPSQIPSQLGNLTELEVLWLAGCNLVGPVPPALSRLTRLVNLDLTLNRLTGSIPTWITQLKNVEQIELFNNSFSGELPEAMGNMTTLKDSTRPLPESILLSKTLSELKLFNNKLTGVLPSQLGANSPLQYVDLSYNRFSGEIPTNLCGEGKLEYLILIDNSFSGEISNNLGKCKSLTRVRLSNNNLSGHIPNGFWGLPRLSLLELSENSFTGSIYETISSAKNLSNLRISKNQFSGSIPNEIGSLKGLIEISGAENDFTGEIPSTLVKLKQLSRLDLSKNQLSGEIPKGIKASKWRSFHKLHFSEHEIADCLDERNVIGFGSSGKVYKAELSGGEVVAVKKLNKTVKGGDEYSDSLNRDVFAAEVETLGTIRHKSIVRLWCCCSSGDCKLLVYEYMPNGSLADVLHGDSKGRVVLGWPERLRIALDAAEDSDYGAKVADFGIAKFGQMSGSKTPEAMSGIAGSCGYIAPEYVYTLRVNEKSDIYSFGVVLLELVTGKQPTDPELGDKDMAKWVCTTLDKCGLEPVIDPKLDLKFKEEISKVIHIGLLCTSPLPLNRPSMRKVVIMLQEVSGAVSCSSPNISKRSKSGGKLSPYYTEDLNSV
ncbi:unnamed protein product [Arabidopsis arenosa]|uniref:Protein kinase domain-containing protein n=1 Tax=Arabidopsis arenosa TaxID=38785 RepID=A0A8S2AR49_ARAAE|nr:unnamed protein product [Arabidopsis arenosa]